MYKRGQDRSIQSRLNKANQRKKQSARKGHDKHRHAQQFITQQEGTGLEGASVDMTKAGNVLDNLAEVLEVVEISEKDIETMSAEELKQRVFDQISTGIDKAYGNAQGNQKFNLSQFYAAEQEKLARQEQDASFDFEVSATAVSSGGEIPQTVLPKREPEPLLSEDDNTDTEHLRNELTGDNFTAESAQSDINDQRPADTTRFDGNSSSEDKKK